MAQVLFNKQIVSKAYIWRKENIEVGGHNMLVDSLLICVTLVGISGFCLMFLQGMLTCCLRYHHPQHTQVNSDTQNTILCYSVKHLVIKK